MPHLLCLALSPAFHTASAFGLTKLLFGGAVFLTSSAADKTLPFLLKSLNEKPPLRIPEFETKRILGVAGTDASKQLSGISAKNLDGGKDVIRPKIIREEA